MPASTGLVETNRLNWEYARIMTPGKALVPYQVKIDREGVVYNILRKSVTGLGPAPCLD
ncbi:MAG: hypothetical protein RQ801_05480 [Spirochaetaceae bacterium]|nr:hypothetical protein [Spirochaetaceae bacterium]MDT8297733.1 hypothetical protein [Spirochaetaceae bacterium]